MVGLKKEDISSKGIALSVFITHDLHAHVCK